MSLPVFDLAICIPSHRPALLPEALASAQAQTQIQVQVLVNASDRLTPAKFNAHPLSAESEFVCTLPDDDWLAPDFGARLVAVARRGWDVVFCGYQEFGLLDRYTHPGAWSLEGFRARNPMCGLTFVMRTALFRALGGFDLSQPYADWDLGYRAFCAGARGTGYGMPLVHYRQHAGNGHRTINHGAAMRALHVKHPELSHV